MNSGEALFRAILAEPENEVLRLICADWLEEQGDPRAEFIRWQCALENLSPGDPHHHEKEIRAKALLKKHQQTWLGPLAKIAKAWKFNRGFVEALTLDAKAFLKRADELFRIAPIRNVRLLDARGHVAALADAASLSRLTCLDLNGNALGAQRIQRIVGSPHLANLRSLYIGYNAIGIAGLQAVLDTANLPGLTELDLSGNFNGGSSISVLANTKDLLRLASLRLVYNRYQDADIETLAASPFVANLTLLDLGSNNIEDHGLRALASSPHLASLKSLGLHYAYFDEPGLEALASSPYLTKLTELDLSHHSAICSLEALAESSRLTQLLRLNLSQNELSDENVKLLANASSLGALRLLSLEKCAIKRADAQTLLRSPMLAGLQRVELAGNLLTAKDKNALRKEFGPRVQF